VNTSDFLPTPSDLEIPPDLHASRPLCKCGAVPTFPLVGMHGDGLTHRVVPWPVVDDDGVLSVTWVKAVGRRYWCPTCGTTVRVAHRGLRRGATYGAAIIAALLHVVGIVPFGQGRDDTYAHDLVTGLPLPASERVRSGRPRWSSLRRWRRGLDGLWPTVALPHADAATRLVALLVAFGAGGPLLEVLGAAVDAHVRGGLAM
jgi:hypothetical protein